MNNITKTIKESLKGYVDSPYKSHLIKSQIKVISENIKMLKKLKKDFSARAYTKYDSERVDMERGYNMAIENQISSLEEVKKELIK